LPQGVRPLSSGVAAGIGAQHRRARQLHRHQVDMLAVQEHKLPMQIVVQCQEGLPQGVRPLSSGVADGIRDTDKPSPNRCLDPMDEQLPNMRGQRCSRKRSITGEGSKLCAGEGAVLESVDRRNSAYALLEDLWQVQCRANESTEYC